MADWDGGLVVCLLAVPQVQFLHWHGQGMAACVVVLSAHANQLLLQECKALPIISLTHLGSVVVSTIIYLFQMRS